LRKKMANYEKQRSIEEVTLERQRAERAKILKDLLNKGSSIEEKRLS